MHKESKSDIYPAIVFAVSELVLGILIQTVDGRVNEWLSFSSVLISFLFSLMFVSRCSVNVLTSAALFFTVISDLFLVIIKPQMKLTAMCFFSLVQILYFLRLYLTNKDTHCQKNHFIVRLSAVVMALVLTVLVLGSKTDALALISMFYFANLSVNTIYAFLYSKRSLCFPIGLLFFMLCDILVGLSVMAESYVQFSESSVLYKITHTNLNLIWLFYVPSQTFLALSTNENRIKK